MKNCDIQNRYAYMYVWWKIKVFSMIDLYVLFCIMSFDCGTWIMWQLFVVISVVNITKIGVRRHIFWIRNNNFYLQIENWMSVKYIQNAFTT